MKHNRYRALISALVVITVIFVLHHFALLHFWYWKFWWFDIVMHFLGGVTIGLGVMWLATVLKVETWAHFNHYRFFVYTLLIVFVVGIAWEYFEIFAGAFLIDTTGPGDMLLDLVMDVVGGGVAYTLFIRNNNT